MPNHVENDEVLACYVEAGRVAAAALRHGAAMITVGARIRDVLDAVEAFIVKEGAGIAFPAQVSRNKVAAHSCPAEDDDAVFEDGDIVKLDCGAHVDGYIGDNAVTVYLGEDEDLQRLVEASRAARDEAVKHVKAGVTPDELGRIIEREITTRGFQPIRNLSGHGVGRFTIHVKPSIPNFPSGDDHPLEAGHVFAIEPFATTGKGLIESAGTPTLFSLERVRPVRSPMARPVVERIKSYQGLPFTLRWLTREFGAMKTRLALHALKQAGVLNEYPPLPEVSGGLVSQSEHTVLVEEDGCRILTE